MKNRITTVIISITLAILHFPSYSQTIKGRIISVKGEPVVGAAVIIQTLDSTYVTGGITNANGNFSLESQVVPFLLLCQHISYIPYLAQYNTNKIDTIILEDAVNTLEEVVIQSEKPLFTIDNGKLSYNVDVLSAGRVVNTAYDVLKELPGVYEQNEAFYLSGANSLTIILNGKPTTMPIEQLYTVLKSLPASRVVKAEIMYSVPPQYHTRGAAINLVLNKGLQGEFQGELYGTYKNKYYNSYTGGGNVLFSTSKVSTDVMYTYSAQKSIKNIDLESHHKVDNTVYDIFQNQQLRSNVLMHNIRAGLDYAINEKNSINLTYTSSIIPKERTRTTATGSFVNSLSKKYGDNGMHNISFNYSSGIGLELGVDYTHYKMDVLQIMSSQANNNSSSKFEAISGQNIDAVSVYADKTQNMANNWILNYGLSFDFDKSYDSQKYYSETDISGLNTNSDLSEHTYDFYAGVGKNFKNGISLSGSVTGEYYKRNGLEKWAIFPQASLTYALSAAHILQFSLSSDKTYPTYWAMQESISYIDGYSEIHGNSNLLPMQNYQAVLLYYLKQKYVFQFFYTYTPDYFQQSASQSPDKVALVYQTLNWDYSQNFGMNVIVPFQIGKTINSRITLTGSNLKVKTNDFYGTEIKRNKWIGRVHLDNSIKLSSKPSISLDLSGYYQTPAIQCTYDLNSSWGVDTGIKWTFMQDRMNLSVMCTDIFNSTLPKAKVDYGNQNFIINTGLYNRSLDIRLSYRFGGYKEKEHRKVDTSRLGH